jgi:carboxyl-terminal processing protease
MPYDTVEPVPFEKVEKPLFKAELRSRSAARVAADPEFHFISEDLDRVKQKLAENKISLNEKVRRTELDEDKARKDARTAERAKLKPVELKRFALTLENVTKPELQLVVNEKKDPKVDPKTGKPEPSVKTPSDLEKSDDADAEDEEEATAKANGVDPIKIESLNILNDLIDLQRTGGKAATASATTPKQGQQ